MNEEIKAYLEEHLNIKINHTGGTGFRSHKITVSLTLDGNVIGKDSIEVRDIKRDY